MSGVALTSVSERTPTLPNAALTMCTIGPDRIAADEREDQRADEERDDDRPDRRRRRQPARDGHARLEADRHAGGTAGGRAASPVASSPPVMSSPIVLDVRRVDRERPDDPALVHHVDPVGQRQDLVELLGDQEDRGAGGAARRGAAVDRLDGADVQAARRLDGDDQAGSDSISRARIRRWRLPPESRRASVSIDGAAIA